MITPQNISESQTFKAISKFVSSNSNWSIDSLYEYCLNNFGKLHQLELTQLSFQYYFDKAISFYIIETYN